MSVSQLFNLFILTSFLGWVYECIYCTLKTTRWQNRGFLFGPVCPIYGLGFLIAYLGYYLPARTNTFTFSIPAIFICCALGSAILEYATSYLLEKIFHARWWDYSHTPLNLHGRICLPATLCFGAAGVLVIGYVLPFFSKLIGDAFAAPAAAWEEAVSLILMCIFGADLALSISSITSVLETLEKLSAEFDEIMEVRYEPIGKTQRALKNKLTDAGHAVAGKIEIAGDYRNALMAHVKNLSKRQVRTLMNMETFSSIRHTRLAARMKELLLHRRNP